MNGKIVYKFISPAYPNPNILYINLIANYSCSNDCLFCSRPRSRRQIGKPNIYEEKANSFLYLKKSPSVKKIITELRKKISKKTEEIAIIGLGEPLIYYQKVLNLLKNIKQKFPETKGYIYKLRIDTNGTATVIHKLVAQNLKKAGLDQIRISLNATNKKDYDFLCRPKFTSAYPKTIGFVKDCFKVGIDTYVSFVVGYKNIGLKNTTKKEYIQFAEKIGIKKKNIILRNYVNPI